MNLRRKVVCLRDYVQDEKVLWSAGETYCARRHRNGTWTIETDKGNAKSVDKIIQFKFDKYFYEVPNNRQNVKILEQYSAGNYTEMQPGTVVTDDHFWCSWFVRSNDGANVVLQNIVGGKNGVKMVVTPSSCSMTFALLKVA